MAALGAGAPALASDLPAPPPPVVPALEPTAIEVPALPPEIVEPPVVVTEIDAENVDVSIRVLSPGEDEGAIQEDADSVISPELEGDITAAAEEAAGDADDPASSTPVGAVNTNVSVRVLSPGSNAGPSQSTDQDTEEGEGERDLAQADAEPAAPGANPAPATTTALEDAQDSEQYQEPNSQYQSEDQIAGEPWNWVWTLELDCAGNPTSTSADYGDPGSLSWSWEWNWKWGCADARSGGPERSASDERAPPSTAEARPPPPTGTSSSSSSPAGASGEPWNWVWTFTFCGQTTTMSTHAGTGTPLSWTWDWTWDWTCGSAPAAQESTPPPLVLPPPPPLVTTPPALPAPSNSTVQGGGTPDATPRADAIQLPTVSLIAILPFTVDTGLANATLELLPAPTMPLEITVDVAIPPAIPPVSTVSVSTVSIVPLAVFPFPPRAAPPAHGPVATSLPSGRHSTTASPSSGRIVVGAATVPASRVRNGSTRQADTRSQPRVARARPDSTPLAPRGPGPRHGAASTSAGSAASSALLVGIVALAGFVFLAAPRLGRRVKVARELSPRGLDRSPLDHPG